MNICACVILPFLVNLMNFEAKTKFMNKYLNEIVETVNYKRLSGKLYHSIFIARRFIYVYFVFRFEGDAAI